MTSNEQIAADLASEVRARHELGLAPIKDLFELAHALPRVDVMSLVAEEEEHGFCVRDEVSERVVIIVATTPHPMRQRSTIAHEIGHVLGGDLESDVVLVPGSRSPEEIRADAFARHLLLPVEAVRHRFASAEFRGLLDLSNLVQEFQVSPQVAAIQLRTAKLISPQLCQEWASLTAPQLAVQFGWFSQYQTLATDSERPRAPQRLMTRAVDAYQRGSLGLSEVSGWYGMSAAEFGEQIGTLPLSTDGPEPDPDDDWDFDGPLFSEDDDSGTA